MDEEYKQTIRSEFEDCVNRTIQRIGGDGGYRPFHTALLTDEVIFWSRFERSFSTSFGQRVIEKISRIVAIAGGADQAENQKATELEIDTGLLAGVDQEIADLRNNRRALPIDWDSSFGRVLSSVSSGQKRSIRVVSDLWWKKDGINNYMSIKTVKPNIDQTAQAKKDLMHLKLSDRNCNVYYGLYYNPYGENRSQYDWSFPKCLFDFNTDSQVLIGKEYWDTLGGDGCYEEVLEIARSVSETTKGAITNIDR